MFNITRLRRVEWWVVDSAGDDAILSRDPMPEKPWLECSATILPFKKRDDKFTATLFLLSHHAMQRFVERCGSRTPFDFLEAVRELWGAVEKR